MIIRKSPREIELMRTAGQIVNKVFQTLQPHCQAGVTTAELDKLAAAVIIDAGAIPTFKDYNGFPGHICISVNDTLIHGIPSKKVVLKEGDIVSLDVGATYKGYCADAARTFPVGNISEEAKALILTTKASFYHAIENHAMPGRHLSDISNAIQTYCEARGFTIPRDYTGHGIGRNLHEEPYIPNFGEAGHGPILREGMCLAIEPMVHAGKKETRVLADGWTVKTVDGYLSAHYENTIVITRDGYEILTALPDEEW